MLVPFAPGGIDVVFRPLAQKLSDQLGRQFYVENVPGGGSTTGTVRVKQAAPDGYTLLATGPAFIINPALQARIPYQPLADFTPVSLAAATSNVLLVNPSLPIRSVEDLIKAAKADPGKYSYASAGVGTPPHMLGELLRQSLGLELVHVPYNSAAQATGSVIAGHTPICFATIGPVVGHIRAGTLRALAVAGPNRLMALPDIPTTAESGYPDIVGDVWTGILAPTRTPDAIVRRLHREIANGLASPDLKERLLALGYIAAGSNPEQFGRQLKDELERWIRVVKIAGIKVQEE
jgi:tripartite-type tricarboxylate transporter receptor subunit TctC